MKVMKSRREREILETNFFGDNNKIPKKEQNYKITKLSTRNKTIIKDNTTLDKWKSLQKKSLKNKTIN